MKGADTELVLLELTRDDLGPDQVMDWEWQAKYMCACNSVYQDYENESLEIRFLRHPKWAIMWACGAAVLRKEFLEIAMKHDPLFEPKIGRVLNKKGEVCDSLYSVHDPATKYLTFRGGPGSKYRKCSSCGYTFLDYNEGQAYENVLIEHSLKGRRSFLLGGRGDLVVPVEAAEEIRALNEKYIRYTSLRVVSSPADGYGLPGDPDWQDIDPEFQSAPENNWESRWNR